MKRQQPLVLGIVFFLAGCATQPPKQEFTGAIKNAKQAGRALAIFRVYRVYRLGGSLVEETQDRSREGGARPAMDIITTGRATLKSISIGFLPYSGAQPVRGKVMRLTVKGPFLPNHVYRFLYPKVVEAANGSCVTPIKMTIKKANGTVIHVNKNDIGQYMVPAIRFGCRAHPGDVFNLGSPALPPDDDYHPNYPF